MLSADLAKGAAAEAIGTFVFVFIGCAAICTDAYTGGEVGLLGIALAHALALGAVVTALGHVSGGHVNPAVTLAALLVRAITPLRAALYFAAQLVGAVTAGLMLTATYGSDLWQPVRLGAPVLGAGVEVSTAIFIEALLTFALVFVVLLAGVDERAAPSTAGLAIGATLGAAILVAGPLTGAALNPARALGPAFASGYWEAQQVYWVGPLLGALVAAVAFSLLRADPLGAVAERD